MIERAPDWQKTFGREDFSSFFPKALASLELQELLKHAQEKYVYWTTFKYYKFPVGITPEVAWAFLKFSHRLRQERTPVRSKDYKNFGFSYTKTLYRRMSFIDTHTAGFIQTLAEKPDPARKEQLIISGLSEEAIASSQIEGANTSRKVAKEMIYSGRKPRNNSEQMIVNNYKVMQSLDSWKDLDLSEDMLSEIQQMITKDTLDVPSDGGRLRVDGDQIVVSDRLTGEIAFEPPKEPEMRAQLKRLIDYANKEEGENDFIHPVLKASIIHFWLAYLHPFVDGNGRTARAIFYWYLLKRGYWLFQYLSVSRVIRISKKRYDESFLHTELDDNDLTYFMLYVTDVICKAISELTVHYEKKVREAEQSRDISRFLSDLNERQILLISFFSRHPKDIADIKTHQSKHGIVYETARRDLTGLAERGFLVETKKGHKKIYMPNVSHIKRVLRR